MRRRLTGTMACAVIGAAIGITWNSTGYAQAPAQAPAPPPQRIQVVVTQLNPEGLLTWEDLNKNELIPVQKKAGIAWRRTYATSTGQGFTRVTVTPVVNYAQADLPGIFTRAGNAEAGANYNAKLRLTIASTHTSIYTLAADASINSNATTPAALHVVQTVRLLPGKGADFLASLREDYLPAYRKAGVKDFWVYNPNMGSAEVLLVRPIDKFADLDRPGLLGAAGLSPEAIAKVNARRNALLAAPIETNVNRFLPELSFGTPPARNTN